MRVLVVESDRHEADRALADLQSAGHEVVRCHESGQPAFPCNGLREWRGCPLDIDRGVDVLLDCRAHPHPRPTPFEDGVTCAARRSIPVVIAGPPALNPFDKWTTAVTHGESVVQACEAAGTAPIETLGHVARTKVRELLADDPTVADATDVVVTRRAERLEAVVALPDSAEDVEGVLAVGVAGAVRTVDHWTPCVDVYVRRFPTSHVRDLRPRDGVSRL